MQYYENIVKKRNSCRGFSNKKVPDEVIADVREYYDNDESVLVEGIRTELKFYGSDVYEPLSRHVGYNGICIKAPGYFVLYSDKAGHFLENAGYIAQGITLKMTEHGLALCWMTINDAAAVKKALGEDNGMEVACVVAFGYRDPKNDEKKAPKLTIDELCLGKDYRTDIDVSHFDRELEDSLRAAAHSQSFLNLQPYRLLVDNNSVCLVGLPSEMTNEYDTYLNYGIVMFNFYAVMWSLRPSAPRWSFDPPETDLRLPEDVKYVAKIRF